LVTFCRVTESNPPKAFQRKKLAAGTLQEKSPKSKQKKKLILQTQKQFDILNPSKQEQKVP